MDQDLSCDLARGSCLLQFQVLVSITSALWTLCKHFGVDNAWDSIWRDGLWLKIVNGSLGV